MYSNILLPVAMDKETDMKEAVAIARSLAGDKARLTLMHVFESLPDYVLSYVPKDLQDATRAGVRKALEDAMPADMDGQVVLLDGSPGRTIVQWAETQGVDLIVLRSHHPSIGDIVWGSTAAYVVRHVGCSVHVIR